MLGFLTSLLVKCTRRERDSDGYGGNWICVSGLADSRFVVLHHVELEFEYAFEPAGVDGDSYDAGIARFRFLDFDE